MLLLCSQSFWYFEDKIYCSLDEANVTLFLKQEWDLSKCKVYLDAIQQLAVKRYEEIVLIRSYILQWDDIYYWKQILEKKKTELLKLVDYKTQIKQAINEFESKFFLKYYESLENYMHVYYSDLEYQYNILVVGANDENDMLVLSQLEQQIRNVSQILNATNLDDIMNVVSSYIYLKQQLIWK